MTQNATRENQDILGYRLKERLGAGGYGEVWSAEAPGGLMKAVKIVFGFHDEQRATNELRSLDRIKELRHPFLLNLERIDVVDGQLVIITELADKSMADEFDEHVEKGNKGIPRDMLLPQLLEAADALDFITFKHSLLHLDIKPENLLMVGRHVKVADFGLVKDLNDVTQSLMSGLTPAYAAPELFDGKPSNTSDQYSLAIVFQEMLTGERPFPGTTPASLAAQHMNGRPNLRPLSKGDQQVVAKALSKDYKVRYPNCVAMIQDLINRNIAHKKIHRKVVPNRAGQGTDSTKIKVRSSTAEATALISNSFINDTPAVPIDAPDCSTVESKFRPTLMVGIGNSANQILSRLHRKITERHKSPKQLPSFRFLCVDTDRNDISRLSRGYGEDTSMTASDTLHLPLRKPEDYRNRQKHLLGWLSRRWIYNVPRSQQTEGIRPLGRLAFIDNFSEVYDSLSDHAEKLSNLELLAETAEGLGMTPGASQDVQVFIVSSISGGVGSGMMADMAYTIKLVLGENGLSSDSVNGLLLSSSSIQAGDPGLAATNAFAFLTELRHYNQYGFPGDLSQGLPELPDTAPFDYTYFLDLGSNLSDHQRDYKFDSVAEYLFLNSVSSTGKFFDECRKLEADIDYFSMRSIGLSKAGFSPSKTNNQYVEELCYAVVDKWTLGTEETKNVVSSLTESVMTNELTSISSERILASTKAEIDELNNNARVIGLKEFLNTALTQEHNFDSMQFEEQAITVFGSLDFSSVTTQANPSVCGNLEQWARTHAEVMGRAICDPISKLLESEKLDLAAPIQTCQWLFAKIQSERDELAKSLESNRSEQREQSHVLLSWFDQHKEGTVGPIKPTIESYIKTKIEEVQLACSDFMFQLLGGYVIDSGAHFTGYADELRTMVATLFSYDEKPEIEDVSLLDKAISNYLGKILPSLKGNVERRLYHELVQGLGGYDKALADSSFVHHYLPESMRSVVQLELSSGATRLDLDNALATCGLSASVITDWIKTMKFEAEPMLDECGGKFRQAVCLPVNSPSPQVGECFMKGAVRSEVSNSTYGDVILVSEAEDVNLANVAFRLLQARPDCIELTKRLHTRNDVEWLTLEDIL